MKKIKDNELQNNGVAYLKSDLSLMASSNPSKFVDLINYYNYRYNEIEDEILVLNYNTLTDVFNDSLSEFLENKEHCDRFDLSDTFLYKKDGWWNTTDDESDIVSLTDVAKYILDNFADFEEDYDLEYEDYFEVDNEEEEEDEEGE